MDYSDCMFSCFLLSNFSACLEVSLTSGTSWNTPRHQATAITTPRLEAKVAIAGSCKRWSNAFRRFAQLEGWNMCFIRLILDWWSKPWMENIELTWRTCSSFVCIYGCFLKWWYPTTMGFSYWKWSFGVFWGYHHLRKHPYKYVTICVYIYIYIPGLQDHTKWLACSCNNMIHVWRIPDPITGKVWSRLDFLYTLCLEDHPM